MKQFTSITLLLIFTLAAFGQKSLEDIRIAHREKFLDKKFPDFSLSTGNSGSFSNLNLKGKVVFINFWFENCPPCIKKIEGLNQLFEKLKKDSNFVFVSFTFEDSPVIERVRKKYGIEYTIYHMESNQCDSICCGYPTSFILDKNGITRFLYVGGSTTNEEATWQILHEMYPFLLKLL